MLRTPRGRCPASHPPPPQTSPPVSWAFSAARGGPTWAPMSKAEIWASVCRTSGEAQDGRGRPWARWGETGRGDNATTCPELFVAPSPSQCLYLLLRSSLRPHQNPAQLGWPGQEVVAWAVAMIYINHHHPTVQQLFLRALRPEVFQNSAIWDFGPVPGCQYHLPPSIP